MTVLDERGRLFGRVNLVDGVVLAFFVLLLPTAYGTWLLFHPKRVEITSVTWMPLTNEQRIVDPLRVGARLKVHGSGFSPLLRAWIDAEPAFAFTYEDPGSAEVIVPPMPPGAHDVRLYDGGQEVARAAKAYVVPATQHRDFIKAIGRLVSLNRTTADALRPGLVFPSESDARTRIASLGPVEPARRSLLVQPGRSVDGERLEVPEDGAVERVAALVLACDPTEELDTKCTVGGVYPAVGMQIRVYGPVDRLTFAVQELLPAAPARALDVTVRFTGGPELALIAARDRDSLLDDRAATVEAIGARQPGAVDVRLRIGADRASDGWRYRGRLVKAGMPFSLTTDRYVANGTVVAVAGEKSDTP